MSLLTALYWLFNNVLLTLIYLPALCSVRNYMKTHVSKTKIYFVLRIFHLETGQSSTLPSILAVRGWVYHKACFDLLLVIGQALLGLTVHIFLRNICKAYVHFICLRNTASFASRVWARNRAQSEFMWEFAIILNLVFAY